MSEKRQPTIKDIAKLVNLHHSTVSLALRHDTRLTEATRLRVHAAAEKLGYRPNPLVSALMSYRARRCAPAYKMELAFLSATETRDEWLKGSSGYQRMWKGALRQADLHGYSLRLYARSASTTSASGFARMLAARNVRGVLIAPLPDSSNVIEIDWSGLSVVELGFTLKQPNFHRVVHDYFHAMRIALLRMRELGYQRIGLVLRSAIDEKVHSLWRMAFIDDYGQLPLRQRVKPLLLPTLDSDVLKAWVARQKPEAILTIEPDGLIAELHKLGLRVPHDIGVASLGCYQDSDSPTAGIYQAYESMGEVAVNLLVNMVQRGDCGVPGRTISTLIGGGWVDGPTLPARSRGARLSIR